MASDDESEKAMEPPHPIRPAARSAEPMRAPAAQVRFKIPESSMHSSELKRRARRRRGIRKGRQNIRGSYTGLATPVHVRASGLARPPRFSYKPSEIE